MIDRTTGRISGGVKAIRGGENDIHGKRPNCLGGWCGRFNFDEAGMAVTERLDRLTEGIADTGSKLVAIGDSAQHYRAERGELGDIEVQVPGVHYGICAGDRVAMIDQHHQPGVERIENGALGEILDINEAGKLERSR